MPSEATMLGDDGRDEYSRLHTACRLGLLDDVQAALAAGEDACGHDGRGLTPLHLAAGYGHTEVTSLLLDAGASVTAGDGTGATALHYAACHNKAAAAYLLASWDHQALHATDCEGRTPAFIAIQNRHQAIIDVLLLASAATGATSEMCRLLQGGAQPDVRATDGLSAIMIACQSGHVDGVHFLVACGAPVDSSDTRGRTALHHTAAAPTSAGVSTAAAISCCRALLAAGAALMPDRQGRRPQDYAVDPALRSLICQRWQELEDAAEAGAAELLASLDDALPPVASASSKKKKRKKSKRAAKAAAAEEAAGVAAVAAEASAPESKGDRIEATDDVPSPAVPAPSCSAGVPADREDGEEPGQEGGEEWQPVLRRKHQPPRGSREYLSAADDDAAAYAPAKGSRAAVDLGSFPELGAAVTPPPPPPVAGRKVDKSTAGASATALPASASWASPAAPTQAPAPVPTSRREWSDVAKGATTSSASAPAPAPADANADANAGASVWGGISQRLKARVIAAPLPAPAKAGAGGAAAVESWLASALGLNRTARADAWELVSGPPPPPPAPAAGGGGLGMSPVSAALLGLLDDLARAPSAPENARPSGSAETTPPMSSCGEGGEDDWADSEDWEFEGRSAGFASPMSSVSLASLASDASGLGAGVGSPISVLWGAPGVSRAGGKVEAPKGKGMTPEELLTLGIAGMLGEGVTVEGAGAGLPELSRGYLSLEGGWFSLCPPPSGELLG